MEPSPDDVPAVRPRRRRAVGPPGARPAQAAGAWSTGTDEPDPSPDDDARLLADVPPHHGGH